MRANIKKLLLLLLCLALAVCTCCLPPLYSAALAQQMLYADCTLSQENGSHPGEIRISLPFSSLVDMDYHENYRKIVSDVQKQVEDIPMELLSASQKLESRMMHCVRADLPEASACQVSLVSYHEFSGFSLLYGDFPQGRADGYVEALITHEAEIRNNWTVGKIFFCSCDGDEDGIPVIPVGVIENSADGYSPIYDADTLGSAMVIPEESMLAMVLSAGQVKKADFRFVLDWRIPVARVEGVLNSIRSLNRWLDNCSAAYHLPNAELWKGFLEEKQSSEILMTLYVLPVLCLLAYVVIAVSSSIVRDDEREISLLLLRGAHKKQILFSYGLQSFLPNLLALPLGLTLALLCTAFFGKATGFMSFDKALPVNVVWNPAVLLYGIAAGMLGVSATFVPCLMLFRTRKNGKPFWKRYFLDAVLLTVALYVYYTFSQKRGTGIVTFSAEPLLFLAVFCFIVGAALLFLRLLTPILRLLLNRFGDGMKPHLQIGLAMAAEKKQAKLTALLMITVMLSLFCANSARTLEENAQSRVMYRYGADCVITLDWQTTESSDKSAPLTKKPFLFETIEGASAVTRVITGCRAAVNNSSAKLMGIDPQEFSRVAWSDGKENSAHLNAYLNLLASEPTACLISAKAAEAWDVKPGEVVYLMPTVASDTAVGFVVYAIPDYFPSYNPLTDDPLIVANAEYLDYCLPDLDYEVWLTAAKTDLAVPENYSVKSITWRQDQLYLLAHNATRRATGGMLSFLFCILLAIGAVSLFLFFIAFLKEQNSTFVTLKALGMKRGTAAVSVVILTTVVLPFLAAVLLAYGASWLFIPLSEAAYSAAALVPPTVLYFSNEDYFLLYLYFLLVLAGMLLLKRSTRKKEGSL